MTCFSRALIACFLVVFAFLASPALADDVQFGGVGLQVVPTINGDLVVLNVLENAPAADKGLLPGDLIFQVNDYPLKGSDFGKVISEQLWGPVGSTVELFYRRPGVAGVSRAILQRSTIDPRLTVTPTVQNGATGGSKGN
ncbi:MAG: PDZ domain-containing protein [Desulfuromonadales bacterium]|nr:PDZ domain-containing protein [Desulfuromonadales bacterium]